MGDESTRQDAKPSEMELLRAEMRAGFQSVVQRLDEHDTRFASLDARITTEAEATRRHFDVVAERIESHVKLVAEVNSHHATVLDNHEKRLQKIEKLA